MNSASAGITSPVTCGMLTRRRPVGVALAWDSSCSVASISARMRRLRSRNSVPSAVRVMLRVLRWNRRTPRRLSSRATRLPTAEALMPNDWPAATKLRVSATRLKTTKPLRLSMLHS